jgi:hypothetical protein
MRAPVLRSALALASALAGFACTDLTGGGSGGAGSGTPVATALSFQTQPGGARVDSVLRAVQVAVLDQNGAVLTTATNPITVALFFNPSGATLLGTTTVAAASGLATFSTLSLDKTGQSYRMVARAAGLDSVTSTPFTIVP